MCLDIPAEAFPYLMTDESHNGDPRFFFLPLALSFFFALVLITLFVLLLLELKAIGYAYGRIGIHPHYVFLVLLLSLVGSCINIPIARLRAKPILPECEVTCFGKRNVIPLVEDWPRTIVAINVGGALIPSVLSFYLLIHNDLYSPGLIAVTLVTAIVHRIARPVAGIGIVIPLFLPPVVAAAIALLLSQQHAPALAYLAGSLGTLIGADLLNLGKVQGLGASLFSIGGAGPFDGIFLFGIVAVLLA
jgi:uncharacterized membrane protein